MKNTPYIYIIGLLFLVSACNLTQEVEIELPEYEDQIMVESYLIPGQPFALLLTQSFSYFAPIPTDNEEYINQLFISDAEVTIRYDDQEIKLENEILFNPFTGKLFNYGAGVLVPENYDSEFELEIKTAEGEIITASTFIPEPIPIDSVVIQFDERDSLARALTYWTDMPNKTNYYRRLFAKGQSDSLEIDFILDDDLTDNGLLLAGTNYDFAVGDTIFNTIYHTTEDYFNFMNSLFNADAANGNPFAQPSSLLSNVEGTDNPLGIFSGLTFDDRRTIIEK
ncbi:MAG: DUF4249 domain-containing protein [Bacteroidota bacterium]